MIDIPLHRELNDGMLTVDAGHGGQHCESDLSKSCT